MLKQKNYDQALVVFLDALDDENNAVNNKITVEIAKERDVVVTKTEEFLGEEALGVITAFKNLKDKEKEKRIQNMLNSVSESAKLIEYEVRGLDDPGNKAVIYIKYRINGYIIEAGQKMKMLKLPEVEYSAYSVGEKDKKYPLYFDASEYRTQSVRVVLPPDHSLYYAPEAVRYDLGFLTYSAGFEKSGDEILFTENFSRTGNFEEPGKYPLYRDCVRKMAEFTDKPLILEKR